MMELYEKYLGKVNEQKPLYRDYEAYYNIILKPFKGKKVNGWTFGYEAMMGSFVFSKKIGTGEQLVYATPYFEGGAGIVVQLVDEDGAIQYNETVKLAPPSGDSKKDTVAYFNALKKYLTI